MLYSPVSQNLNPHVSAPEQHVSVPLEDLARRIRAGHQDIRAASGLSVDRALDVGDDALAVQVRVGSLKRWLKENGIVVSTTLLYAQLAKQRTRIEAARKENPDFSLNDARRLIAQKRITKKADANTTAKAQPSVSDVLNAALAAEITAWLMSRGVNWFLKTVMPPSWIFQLTARLTKLPRASCTPSLRSSEALRRALSLVEIADRPDTKQETATINEREALNALRAVATMMAGETIDHVCVAVSEQPFKEKRCSETKKARRAA